MGQRLGDRLGIISKLFYRSAKISEEFCEVYKAGEEAKHDGIYRCSLCFHEVVRRKGEPLPPELICSGHDSTIKTPRLMGDR